MMSSTYRELENKYAANNYKPADVVITKGKGVWVWDVEGNRYLDCVSGYGALNQGHCNNKIYKAVTAQAEKLTLISRAFRTDLLGVFSKELCEKTDSDKVILMNSGAEAVETALKTTRKWGYVVKKIPRNKGEIIVCENNFHGRTLTVIGFSTMKKVKGEFGPYGSGFKIIPYNDPKALEKAITVNTTGFLVEPIQGEGGIRIPDDGYLKEVRSICTDKKVPLIFDEIQTGLGRTGYLLAEEHEQVRSDMSIIGKSLGGGFLPVSAVLSRGGMLDVLEPGDHGSTFGGNPLACAAGLAALAVIDEDGLIANAQEKGEYLKSRVESLTLSGVKQVRGRGLMLGIEMEGPADDAVAKLLTNGLLCNKAGANVIRFTPPLTITEEEANWALEKLSAALSD